MEGHRTSVTSPLLVRMLLVVHYSERRLPDQRAELYMKATDAILLPEYTRMRVANRPAGWSAKQSVHRELVNTWPLKCINEARLRAAKSTDDLRQVLTTTRLILI
ncbi:MAG: hypothetical protein H6633_31315 [Anaerolineales bacterium]|nr:hypothetical protein [Anaerolineales bacterium]